MRIPRLYTPQTLCVDSLITLESAAAHYLSNVLRMAPGRDLILFNGQGGEYSASVDSVRKKTVVCKVNAFVAVNRESLLHTELAIGISKGERMDWVIQKATELGATAITPLYTERTEVKLHAERLEKKLQHWQQIIVSASEQSQRTQLPVLNNPQGLVDYLAAATAECKLILHPMPQAFDPRSIAKPASVALLIGPEGGFSDAEIALSAQQGFSGWTIGPRILRTETAPLVALALVQQLWGDF